MVHLAAKLALTLDCFCNQKLDGTQKYSNLFDISFALH